jgi:hypothetical protein
MATLSKGYTFGATEIVTNAKLHSLVDDATITGIVNTDVDATAAIAESKIEFDDVLGHTHSGSGDGTIVDLSAPNAIGGTTPNDGTFEALVGTTIDGPLGSVTPSTIEGTTIVAGTSLQIGSGVIATDILDEDDMASDSNVKLATQQSIKAYVDKSHGVYTQTVTRATADPCQIPNDNTIPQNTEGLELMTRTITPKSATSILRIDICVVSSSNADTTFNTIALFQDATAGALAAAVVVCATAELPVITNFTYFMTSGTTSETTFKVRGGNSGANKFTINGNSTTTFLGGIVPSSIRITEFK